MSTDDPASLAPADTGLFIRLNNLSAHRMRWSDDPLGKIVRQQLPFQRQPQAWEAIQQKLGLDGTQIIDRYFGRSIAVIGRSMRNGPAVVVSRIDPADGQLAVERLGLQPVGKIGRADQFTAYRTGDGKGYVAFSDQWMVLAQSGDTAQYASMILDRDPQSPSLADDESYKYFAAAHADSSAMLFARDPSGDELHCIAGKIEDRALSLSYRGRNADFRKLFIQLGDATAHDFGPAPVASSLAAVSFNITEKESDPKRAAFMDRILAPRSYARDLKPMIGSPLVLFATPTESGKTPAIGAAVRLRDHAAGMDFDRLADGLLLALNFKTLELGIDPVARGKGEHGGASYQTADVGATLAAAQKQPILAGLLKMTYGRIGDWYVVCTQESAYRQCLDAVPGAVPESKQIQGDATGQQPIVAGVIHPSQAAAVLKAFTAANQDSTFPPFQEAAGKLNQVAQLLEHYSSLAIQFDRGRDDYISGRVRLDR